MRTCVITLRGEKHETGWAPPQGCACVAADGSLLPTIEGSREELYCPQCQHVYGGAGCFFADYAGERRLRMKRERKRERELATNVGLRKGHYCAWPGCPETIGPRSELCVEHKAVVMGHMFAQGISSYEQAKEELLAMMRKKAGMG